MRGAAPARSLCRAPIRSAACRGGRRTAWPVQSTKHDGAGERVAEKVAKSRAKAQKADETPMGPTGRPYHGFPIPER